MKKRKVFVKYKTKKRGGQKYWKNYGFLVRKPNKKNLTDINIMEEGKKVGAITYMGDPATEEIELSFIEISPEFQGRGFGEKAIGDFEDYSKEIGAKKLTLVSKVDNTPFWEDKGFEVVKEIPSEGEGPFQTVALRKFKKKIQ